MAGNGFISVVLEFDFQIIVIPTPHAETSRATTRKITAMAAHPSINSSAPVEARHDMRTNKRAIGAASREKPWPPPHQRQTPQNTPMIVSHQLRQWRRRCSAATQVLITRRLSTPTSSENAISFKLRSERQVVKYAVNSRAGCRPTASAVSSAKAAHSRHSLFCFTQ